jgi:integrase
MYYSTLTDWLFKTIKKYNNSIDNNEDIPKEEKENYKLPVISFHKLRHTSATLLIGQNTDIRTVSARLGHAQTSTTLNIYVHGLNSLDLKASNSLENLLVNNKDTKLKKAK